MPRKAGYPTGATDGWTSPNDAVPLVAATWHPVTGGAQPQRNDLGPWPFWASSPTQDRWTLGNAKQPAAPKQAGQGWLPPHEAQQSTASSSLPSSSLAKWACRAVGPCLQCSKQEAKESYCYPYGSRRLVDCIALEAGLDVSALANFTREPAHNEDGTSFNKSPMPLDSRTAGSNGGTLGYESCGRDLGATRITWASFVILDLFLALGALMLLVSRQRLLAGRHRSVLAGRIAGSSTTLH